MTGSTRRSSPFLALLAVSLVALAWASAEAPRNALAAKAAAAWPAGTTPAAKARFQIAATDVEAGPELGWNFPMWIFNDDALGLYVDSVTCRTEDKDPGETRTPRISEVLVPGSAQGMGTISGSDSAYFNQTMPSTFEEGTLSFRLFGHRSNGDHVAMTSTTVRMHPGPTSAEYPSETIAVNGKKVEVVLLRSKVAGPAAGVLLVHDHGAHARKLMLLGLRLAYQGYTAMLVSLPGYGLSEGPPDYAGPASVAALSAALDRLKHTADVDSTRLGAWGFGRGASAVASLAASRGDLRATVVQAGVYDLWATYRGTPAGVARNAIVSEAGKDSSGWAERSPIRRAGSIHSAALLVHGENDAEAPVGQARAFAAALQASADTVETRFQPGSGHEIARSTSQSAALQFLSRKLRH